MIFQRIFSTEQKLKQEREANKKKLLALNNIKGYLNQIDHSFEIVPMGDLSRLNSLFIDLKEAELSDEEELMLGEVFGKRET